MTKSTVLETITGSFTVPADEPLGLGDDVVVIVHGRVKAVTQAAEDGDVTATRYTLRALKAEQWNDPAAVELVQKAEDARLGRVPLDLDMPPAKPGRARKPRPAR